MHVLCFCSTSKVMQYCITYRQFRAVFISIVPHVLYTVCTVFDSELEVRALSTPCHTRGHIMFMVTGSEGAPALFSGDTLFVGGCGRFFEGEAKVSKAIRALFRKY
jgi:glyoxylase-like metal-dependent hydrolase (beta-lactamase superfamily II)